MVTMKAWQKHIGNDEPVHADVPIPSTPPDGFLVKILAAGVCHSDFALMHTNKARPPHWQEKYTLGHEGCGEIIDIGSEVNDARFKKGTIIAILAVPGCLNPTCPQCAAPTNPVPQICEATTGHGIGSDGSFAPYIAIPSRAACPIPPGVAPPQAAVATDACLTAYHAVHGTGKVTPDETVLLFGLGGLGFNALQILLRDVGVKEVIVADRRVEVLDEAVRFGVKRENVVPVDADVVEFVGSRGLTVDVVMDFVGVEQTFGAGLKIVRPGGRLVQIGLLAPVLPLDNLLAVRKQLSILCSYGGVMAELQACLDLIARGVLQPQVETGDMGDFPDVLKRLHEGGVKSRMALVPGKGMYSRL